MAYSNCVVLNGTRGGILIPPAASSTVLSPVRQATKTNMLYYDTTTKEVTYDVASGGGGPTFGTEIAIGTGSGTGQGASTVAIGNTAASYNQGANSVAIGLNSGGASPNAQSADSVAIGNSAGKGQGQYTVALGNSSGSTGQGTLAVAIGNKAGETSQAAESIVLNASSTALNPANDGTFVKPIREIYTDPTYKLWYDGTTGEISTQLSSITQLWTNFSLAGLTPATGVSSPTFTISTASNIQFEGYISYGASTPGTAVTFRAQLIRQSDSVVVATSDRLSYVYPSASAGMHLLIPFNQVYKNVGAASYKLKMYSSSGTGLSWDSNNRISMLVRIN